MDSDDGEQDTNIRIETAISSPTSSQSPTITQLSTEPLDPQVDSDANNPDWRSSASTIHSSTYSSVGDPEYIDSLPRVAPHKRIPERKPGRTTCICIRSGILPNTIRLLNRLKKKKKRTPYRAGTREISGDVESDKSEGDSGADSDKAQSIGNTYAIRRLTNSQFDRIAGQGTAIWSLSEENFCRSHVRQLAGGVGLRTSSHTSILLSRLKFLFQHLEDLPTMRTDYECDQFSWFQRSARTPAPSDAYGVFKYPVEFPKPRVDRFIELGLSAADIYDRVIYRAPDRTESKALALVAAWEADGSIVAPLFQWLGDKTLLGCEHGEDISCEHDSGLWPIVDLEFEMYEHHRGQGEDRNSQGIISMGWLRSMWHSLIQQLIRQDPAYYALYVLLRPDHTWRLISSPYYSKSTSVGARTAFRHIDINVPRYLSRGRSANIIQGSVTLTDEDEANCTELLLGMHKDGLIQEWWTRIEERGLSTDGMVHNVTRQMWSQDDTDHFGIPWTKQVCQRGDVRISRPQLPHGSTGPATRIRRTVLPWFIGIKEDHEQLDTNDAGNWSEVAEAHRALMPSLSAAPGFSSVHRGTVPYPFPGAVHLQGLGAISDALVGRRRWDNTSVVSELDVLFGESTDAARVYIQSWRQRAATAMTAAFQEVIALEVRYYRDNSFFRSRGFAGAVKP